MPFLLLLTTNIRTLTKANVIIGLKMYNVKIVQLKIIEMNIIGIAVCSSGISFFTSFRLLLYFILFMNFFCYLYYYHYCIFFLERLVLGNIRTLGKTKLSSFPRDHTLSALLYIIYII